VCRAVKLSVIIPGYNEQTTILDIMERVHAQAVPQCELEVMVVDDGSTDRTAAIIDSRPDLYARALHLTPNRGKGAAVKAGLEIATGEYVLFQDADLEYDPVEYPKLVMPALKYGADVVMGSRTLAPNCRRVHYFWNKLGNGLVTLAFNALFNTTFSDVYTCYFLFRRSLVDPLSLRTVGFDQQAEILAKCVKHGRVFYEVPIDYHGRSHAEGKKIRTHHVVGILAAMIRERFSRRP
jgi:glycosyltransferase involved in cell wall biosynthesis